MASSIIFFLLIVITKKGKKSAGLKKTSNLSVVFVVALQKGWIWSDYSHSLFVGKILFLLLEQIGRCPIIDHTRATIWKQHFFCPGFGGGVILYDGPTRKFQHLNPQNIPLSLSLGFVKCLSKGKVVLTQFGEIKILW